ncbi:hypothetical protein OBBRIDRAFT_793874 [Obba rivulosa]|uniref:Uncharacterized protein n=1 Tax=Obba rivulosa TaxID=1052685 RepID=A0A8E2AS02_9APHY|nr:hypothetical protein OBBRIDRAFT_793874 [Obba rivulosa]
MSASGKMVQDPEKEKGTAPAAVDAPALREQMGKASSRLEVLAKGLKTFSEEPVKVSNVQAMDNASKQLQELASDMRSHQKKQSTRIEGVKTVLKTKLKDQVAEQMKAQIQEQIKAEILLQVKVQIDLQIREHLLVPLQDVVGESKRQLVEVDHALQNSSARRVNALLRGTNLDDTLGVVLKPDGSKSKLYPANLRSLFAYDDAMTNELLKHHGLTCYDQREKNLNRFLSHIGVHFQLVHLPSAVGG